jgi:hypothetical protein
MMTLSLFLPDAETWPVQHSPHPPASVQTTDLNEEHTLHHHWTYNRQTWQPKKETCSTLDELERVIASTVRFKTYTWNDTTHSLVRYVEFNGEALERIMCAGIEALGRKRSRQEGARAITLPISD